MLTRLGEWVCRWTAHRTPFSNAYGYARSIIALGSLMTLVATPVNALIRPAAGIYEVPVCTGPRVVGVFCVLHPHLELARWLAVFGFLVVASGWRPRLTGVLHWYLSVSIQANVIMIDGGDQVAAVLTAILLPVTLVDSRRWHWTADPPARTDSEMVRSLVALVFLTVARIQVAGIYFHAAMGKFSVPEWTNGTALYYWFLAPNFGAPEWLRPLIVPLVLSPVIAPLMAWTVLIGEYLLSTGLVIDPKFRVPLFWMGLSFHAAILVVHGLVSFGMSMCGALILYLWPLERPIRLRIPVPKLTPRAREALRPAA